MSNGPCLADDALLALALGEPAAGTVHAHLDSCPSCSQGLRQFQVAVADMRQAVHEWGPLTNLTRPASFPDDAALAPQEGAERPVAIGRYPVVDVIGESGQAVVYRAVHPTLPGRELVIKLSRRSLGDDLAARYWPVREGKALAGLDHPGLVRIHDLDFHEGRPFLVMDYVPGRNLAQHAAAQRPTPRPWWPRWHGPSPWRTAAASCTGTSSRPTSSSTRPASRG
jgi:hypothetical protein